MSASDPEKYQSPARATVRFAAQEMLLKPLVWRLCRVEVHGAEHLDGLQSPYIVTANHSSHLDTALIYGALPPRLSRYLAVGAAADYFFDKKYKSLIPQLFFNAYPVERKGYRSRKGLSKKLLAEGVPLLIFAEGTRSRTGAMAHFKPGVAALCISFDIPCVPIALVGAYAAWPSMQKHLPRGRPEIHVVIGHPLSPGPGELAHAFSERIRRNVAELHDSTARAYGLPTLDDYTRAVALAEAASASSPESPSGPEPALDALPTVSEPPAPPRHPTWLNRAVSAAKAASDALVESGSALTGRKDERAETGTDASGTASGAAATTGTTTGASGTAARLHRTWRESRTSAGSPDTSGTTGRGTTGTHPSTHPESGTVAGSPNSATTTDPSGTTIGTPDAPAATTGRSATSRREPDQAGHRDATSRREPDQTGHGDATSTQEPDHAGSGHGDATSTRDAPRSPDGSTGADAGTRRDRNGHASPELDQRVKAWFSRLHKDTSDTTKEPQ